MSCEDIFEGRFLSAAGRHALADAKAVGAGGRLLEHGDSQSACVMKHLLAIVALVFAPQTHKTSSR
jgi:hypothetical protein